MMKQTSTKISSLGEEWNKFIGLRKEGNISQTFFIQLVLFSLLNDIFCSIYEPYVLVQSMPAVSVFKQSQLLIGA